MIRLPVCRFSTCAFTFLVSLPTFCEIRCRRKCVKVLTVFHVRNPNITPQSRLSVLLLEFLLDSEKRSATHVRQFAEILFLILR